RLLFDADCVNPFQLDARLRAAVRALQRIDFQTGRLLRLVAELRLHRVFGFPSLPDYVRERLGCSPRETAWVARAQEVTVRRLSDVVDWALEAGASDPPPAEATLVLPPLDQVQM